MSNWKTSSAIILSALALMACNESAKQEDDQPNKCEYTVAICNADGTALLTCENGEEKSKSCKCANGACVNDESKDKCTYTAPKCNADGTALLVCSNGTETSKSCKCENNQCIDTKPEDKCSYTSPKCNADGTALLVCSNGTETSKSCKCENNQCKDTAPDDKPVATVPKITELAPTSGKIGDTVSVLGEHLDGCSKVCFDENCVTPSEVTDKKVSAVAPDGSGAVKVSLTIGTDKLTAGTFNYIAQNPEPNAIDWCKFSHVEPNAVENTPVTAYAEVFEDGKTGSSSSHSGIKAQVGTISTSNESLWDTSKWDWKDAKRNENFDAPASGNNDEYMAELSLKEGSYRVAYRFSLDGSNWTYCDYSSSENGFDANDTGVVTVTKAPVPEQPSVGWCRIMNNTKSIESMVGEASEGIYAQAFVKDCTHFQNHCNSLIAEVGYGPRHENNVNNLDKTYTWSPAAINPEYNGSGGELHDEFVGTIKSEKSGQFNILYRLSLDNGESWTYCDTTDDPTFEIADGMDWTVKDNAAPEPDKKEIEWCQFFTTEFVGNTINAVVNVPTSTIYGQAYVNECTEGDGKCDTLTAYIGYGAKDASPDSFKFSEVPYVKTVGNNDEFAGSVTVDKSGEYALIYAFSLDGGKTKKYCGSDDSGVFSMDKAAKLVVSEEATEGAPFVRDTDFACGIDNSQASIETVPGTDNLMFGQIYIKGCTEPSACNLIVDSHFHYIEEFRFSTNDIATSGYWHVVDATINTEYTGADNNEFMATVNFSQPGTYRYAYSFDLKHDPSDVTEKAQRVFCFVNWDGYQYGSAYVKSE